MILFFNACSRNGYIGLFSKNRECIASKNFFIAGNESSKTIHIINSFLTEHAVSYMDIEDIICVNGPGSFTGIRTISLVINTLAYIYPHIYITPVNFFDLFMQYPIVKGSSKRDLFVKYQKGDIIQIVQNKDFEEALSGDKIYGDVEVERFAKKIDCNVSVDYISYCKNIVLQKHKKIAPLYIKKPNIS